MSAFSRPHTKTRNHPYPGAHRYFRIATAQSGASEACLGHRHILGFLSRCDTSPFSRPFSHHMAEKILAGKNPKRVGEVWAELLALFASGRLKPVVYDGRYTLDTLARGLQDLEDRKTWGKVVVRVREPTGRAKL